MANDIKNRDLRANQIAVGDYVKISVGNYTVLGLIQVSDINSGLITVVYPLMNGTASVVQLDSGASELVLSPSGGDQGGADI